MADRRRSAATATVGAAGVGGAAALRHEALVRNYGERSATPVKRPRILAESRLLKHGGGRRLYAGAAGLSLVAVPTLATGVHGLIHGDSRKVVKREDRRPFWQEGVLGAKDAVVDRTHTATEHAPKKLVAGNYLAGVGVGSATSGLTHLALRKKKIPGHAKSAIAAVGGIAVGTAALPVQSRLTNRYSHGKYVVTPTGVRRAKEKAKRPTSQASVYDARSMSPAQFRSQTVGKAAWKAFYPAPPSRGGAITKIPRSKLRVESADERWAAGNMDIQHHKAFSLRGKEVGQLRIDDGVVGFVHTEPGFRRRGVAGHLLRQAESHRPVRHSAIRSTEGNAWAHAMDAKRGTKPVMSNQEDTAIFNGAVLGHSTKKVKRYAKGKDYTINRRAAGTIESSSTRTGGATRGPLGGASRRKGVYKALRVKVVDVVPPPRAKRKPSIMGPSYGLTGGAVSTTAGDVSRAYNQSMFTTSSGARRTMRRKEFEDAVAEVRRQRGPTLHERNSIR